MPRTVVPPVQLRGPDARSAPGTGDGLPDRLVKYVPAETLAFFVPVAASLGTTRNALLVSALCAGLVGTLGYLWLAAQRAPVDQRPLWFFYPLAGLAYLAWTVGTSANVAALLEMDQLAAGVVLGVAVFLIPLADQVATKLVRP